MKGFICLLALTAFLSCKSKKQDEVPKNYFSIVSFLKAEAKNMDTMPLKLTRITNSNNLTDTAAITKQDFHRYVNEFVDIPDISTKKMAEHYEESNTYDDILNNVLLTYTAKNDDDEVRRETVMMEPVESGNSKIKTILLNKVHREEELTVEKDLTWHIGQRMQIVTKKRKPNTAEEITTEIIKWE